MNSDTSPTMLRRLHDGADPLVWQEFFDRYWRVIFAYAKSRGCTDDTAEDVIQDVMLTVFEKRDVFRYDPAKGRFRDWLRKVVQNGLINRRGRASERVRARGGEAEEGIAFVEADDASPQQAWELAFEQALLLKLLDVVRREVSPRTYQAFELLALNDCKGNQVSTVTGLSTNAAYQARKRVTRRLRELGAQYRNDGQLAACLKQAWLRQPGAEIERSLTDKIHETMSARAEGDSV